MIIVIILFIASGKTFYQSYTSLFIKRRATAARQQVRHAEGMPVHQKMQARYSQVDDSCSDSSDSSDT